MAVRTSRQSLVNVRSVDFAERCQVLAARYAVSTVYPEAPGTAPRRAYATRLLNDPAGVRLDLVTAVAAVIDIAGAVGSDPDIATDNEITTAITASWNALAGS